MTLKFNGWPWKTIGHLFYTTSSYVHHFESIGEYKLELQSRNAQFGSKSAFFCPVWPWNLTDDLEKNRAPFLCCFKLCASFHSHQWIHTGVTVQKPPIWVKIDDFFSCVTLKLNGWPCKTIGEPLICYFKLYESFHTNWWIQIWVTVPKRSIRVKNNRAPLLCYFKLCAAFRTHWWIQTGVAVHKRPMWVKCDDF